MLRHGQKDAIANLMLETTTAANTRGSGCRREDGENGSAWARYGFLLLCGGSILAIGPILPPYRLMSKQISVSVRLVVGECIIKSFRTGGGVIRWQLDSQNFKSAL
jgi:hypothetical protein